MTVVYYVALCTHNHADRLERTLADLATLKSPEASWELLVIDNGCRDATPELLACHAWPAGWHVRVVREDKLGLSNARNRAIAEARGEYVIFMDDDVTADPDWLCAYERLILDKRPDAFGGRIRVPFEDMRPPWLTDELLGFLGELKPQIAEKLDVPVKIFVFQLWFNALCQGSEPFPIYSPLPRYPAAYRDMALVLPAGVQVSQVIEALLQHGQPWLEEARLFDAYSGPSRRDGPEHGSARACCE